MTQWKKTLQCLTIIAIVCGGYILTCDSVSSEKSAGEIVASLDLENVVVLDADHNSFIPAQDLNILFVDSEWLCSLSDSSAVCYLRGIVQKVFLSFSSEM